LHDETKARIMLGRRAIVEELASERVGIEKIGRSPPIPVFGKPRAVVL